MQWSQNSQENFLRSCGRLTQLNFQVHFKAKIIKAEWSWPKDRWRDQWNTQGDQKHNTTHLAS
jgi:hypothetical protein